ncbi:hypothetical protein B0H66DRAFT_32151 [Apodospora peruviana]|uniref:Uncharacterized protein n=1 Tax=Apodospora peruviana TaxID=516989 RepID=A0AAE0MFZ3_9PEZI|nr:hypothetical protein B0H66DRAFT_32151 [Apodospora peruviana]
MEQLRTARRSASHGALNRRYAADNVLHPPMLPSHPFSRPLRGVQDNLSFLASPGPLESMLKTTTETGDIGTFSIKSSRSSGTVSGPFRSRPGFGDVGWQRRPSRSNGADPRPFRDDRRRLPCYRDTTSEIISMYGSGSQRSASSSLSPPFDDVGQRSYSMTSSSSRALPSKKSSGTMKSQYSGSLLQRPRSPFPYPTRLKRPGMRPSSPAWTENGGVDYTRMVEIDRFSHRTVPGPYIPPYSRYGRRPPLTVSRFDANRSVPSLPTYNIMAGQQYCSGQAPSVPTIWGSSFRGRLDSSTSDRNMRSSGLTSIIDMYRPSSCAPSTQSYPDSTQHGGTFYYDYSEDFDYVSEHVAPLTDPLAPIPTRAAGMRRPMVLDEACNLRFRDSYQQNLTALLHIPFPGDTFLSQTATEAREEPQSLPVVQNSQEPLYKGSAVQAEAERTDLEMLSGVTFEPNSATYHLQLSTDEQQPGSGSNVVDDRFQTPLAHAVQGITESVDDDCDLTIPEKPTAFNQGTALSACKESSRQVPVDQSSVASQGIFQERLQHVEVPARSRSQPSSIQRSLSLSCVKKESVASTFSSHPHRSKFYSFEPGLSDLASLVLCRDKASSLSIRDDMSDSYSVAGCSTGKTTNKPSGRHPHQTLRLEPDAQPTPSKGAQGSFGGSNNDVPDHGRAFAVANISTSQLPGPSESDAPSSQNGSATPILSPQPISPARRLRLQNSVPELMKALPPLPGTAKSEHCVENNTFNGLDLSMRFSPLDLSCVSTPKSMLVETSPIEMSNNRPRCEYGKKCGRNGMETYGSTEQKSGTRLDGFPRAVLPSVFSPADLLPRPEDDSSPVLTEYSENPTHTKSNNGRLKLKVSRGALVKAREESGSSTRDIIVPPSQSWQEGSSKQFQRTVHNDYRQASINTGSGIFTRNYRPSWEGCNEERAFIGSHPPATRFTRQVPADSGRYQDGTLASPQKTLNAASEASLSDVRSSLSDGSIASGKPPQGLRKRVSDLRIRLAESRLWSAESVSPKEGTRRNIENISTASNVTSTLGPVTADLGCQVPVSTAGQDNDTRQSQQKGFKGRMSKWMKKVRQAVMVACTGPGKRG